MAGLFSLWRDWREQRAILREFKRDKASAAERDRFIVRDNLTFALSALERDDRRRAIELWTNSLAQYPEVTRQSRLALTVLVRLQRYDEAQELMTSGRKRSPRDPFYVQGLAEIAQARRDYTGLLAYAKELRTRFPAVLQGYTMASVALLALGQPDEAEAVAQKAIVQFPDELLPHLEYTRVAAQREDWEEVLRRSEQMMTRFNFCGSFVGSADALIKLKRFDEADQLLDEARTRFGTDAGPSIEWARVAEARGDMPEAVARWKRLSERFPLHLPSQTSAAEAMVRLGDSQAAIDILVAAIDRFPGEPRPLTDLGRLQLQLKDFSASDETWTKVRALFPKEIDGYFRGADALQALGKAEEAGTLRKVGEIRHRELLAAG
jgi:tetratricopeptide (TPR) repeat protein